jgi:tetratricopeptide (TPR) repeat protein
VRGRHPKFAPVLHSTGETDQSDDLRGRSLGSAFGVKGEVGASRERFDPPVGVGRDAGQRQRAKFGMRAKGPRKLETEAILVVGVANDRARRAPTGDLDGIRERRADHHIEAERFESGTKRRVEGGRVTDVEDPSAALRHRPGLFDEGELNSVHNLLRCTSGARKSWDLDNSDAAARLLVAAEGEKTKLRPMNEAETLRTRAREALLGGDTASGIDDLKAYLEKEPDDASAWLDLGTAYAAIEHRAQAVQALKTAVELDETVLDARLAYARALAAVGKIDDAAFQLIQANRIAPDDARVMKELGVAFYDKRLFDKAATWLKKAVVKAPEDSRAHYALGLAEEARHDIGAALAAYREAVRRAPAFVDARRTLADALAQMGEHEQAIAELDALLRLERSNEQAAKNREILSRALEEMKKARLLGKTEQEVKASALVERGKLVEKLRTPQNEGKTVVRYGSPFIELDVAYGASREIESMTLVFPFPERIAGVEDEAFRVTVLDEGGHPKPVVITTAATLTFLRESLGCPMTEAAKLLTRLFATKTDVSWGGASIAFATQIDGKKERHGIRVS